MEKQVWLLAKSEDIVDFLTEGRKGTTVSFSELVAAFEDLMAEENAKAAYIIDFERHYDFTGWESLLKRLIPRIERKGVKVEMK